MGSGCKVCFVECSTCEFKSNLLWNIYHFHACVLSLSLSLQFAERRIQSILAQQHQLLFTNTHEHRHRNDERFVWWMLNVTRITYIDLDSTQLLLTFVLFGEIVRSKLSKRFCCLVLFYGVLIFIFSNKWLFSWLHIVCDVWVKLPKLDVWLNDWALLYIRRLNQIVFILICEANLVDETHETWMMIGQESKRIHTA